jgi:hypothetical protein
MPGQRPGVHVKTRQADEQNLSEVAIAWKKTPDFSPAWPKLIFLPATNMVFIDKPKEQQRARRKFDRPLRRKPD